MSTNAVLQSVGPFKINSADPYQFTKLTNYYWQNFLTVKQQDNTTSSTCCLPGLLLIISTGTLVQMWTTKGTHKYFHTNRFSLQSFSRVHWLTLCASKSPVVRCCPISREVSCHWQAKGHRCCDPRHPIRGVIAQTGNWLSLTFFMQQCKVWINGFIKVTWPGIVPNGPP